MYDSNVWAKLSDKLDSLAQNRKEVSLDLLTTKYKKAYARLLDEIAYLAGEVIGDYVLAGVQFAPSAEDDKDLFMQEAKKIIEEERKPDGVYTKAINVLLETCDVRDMLIAVTPLRKRIILGLYAPFYFGFGMPGRPDDEEERHDTV
jgi:hypothetical protein